MKIAICASGHLRNWEENLPNFLEFRNHLAQYGDVDTFVATWDRENTEKSWSEMAGLSNLERCKVAVTKERVQQAYGVKDCIIHDDLFYSSTSSPFRTKIIAPNEYNFNEHGQQNGIPHSMKQYFLIHESNKLKLKAEYESGERYDLVLRVRPDYIFFSDQYSKFSWDQISDDVLYIRFPAGSPIGDQFAFASSHIMDIYASTYLVMSCGYHSDIFGDPETFLHFQVTSHNITCQKMNTEHELYDMGCLNSEMKPGHYR